MSDNKIMWGSDPEFFAGYEKGGKTYVMPPVVFRVELDVPTEENGTHPIFKNYDGTLVHEDGAAFEMSTPPSNNWSEMWDRLNDARLRFGEDVLSLFPDMVKKELLPLPTINWESDEWSTKGAAFHLATIFGCDPDQDVYNTKSRAKIMDAKVHPYRYGGGHIHVSGINEIQEQPLLAIRSLALTAGLASVAFSDVPELDRERTFLYGKPGKFRVQRYSSGKVGIEYRTPSNRWTSDKAFAEKVFTWAEIGIKSLLQGGLLVDLASKVEVDAIDAIITCNQDSAKSILDFISTSV